VTVKNSLRLHYEVIAAAAGLLTVESDSPDPGELWCIQHCSVRGSSTTSGGNTRAQLYVSGHGYKHPLEEQDAPEASVLYSYSDDVYILPGERLSADWDQAQANCLLELFVEGYRLDRQGGVNA
jgi:hypothetical protein